MDHLAILLAEANEHEDQLQGAVVKATGRYYTHRLIGSHLVRAVWGILGDVTTDRSTLSVLDPFGGDDRLVMWLIRFAIESGRHDLSWNVHLWDLDESGLETGRRSLDRLASEHGVRIDVEALKVDSFRHGRFHLGKYDVVVTNPPWELLRPDRRDLDRLTDRGKEKYIEALREYDGFLAESFPLSQPARKFAGWGTNLARVGTELAVKLVRAGGVVGIVSPASLLADEMSVALRKWLLKENTLADAAYFPAEARLFAGADVSTATLAFSRSPSPLVAPRIATYSQAVGEPVNGTMTFPTDFLEATGYVIPVSFGTHGIRTLVALSRLPTFASLENDSPEGLWAGRELDETGISRWLGEEGDGLFIKGRMIDRFRVVEPPKDWVRKAGWRPTPSTKFSRIVWRDVSRPNQKRRMKATIIQPGWIAGNSLGVAYFRDGDETRLRALLGLMSSFAFEFQLRSYLATGHVSLGALRKVHLPPLSGAPWLSSLASAVADALAGRPGAEVKVEAIAAHAYGLTRSDLEDIIDHFPKVTTEEKRAVLSEYDRLASEMTESMQTCRVGPEKRTKNDQERVVIANHRTAKLSALDLQVAIAVPPGGNWKDIPESVPSKRLETIRESYRKGKGSRSTYYGRLRADLPSYTINTYFNRPGNGCHLHYDYHGGQHRVISQREAARLQSFPDAFIFHGTQTSINKQIGNAVPPLLAYQIARTLGQPGFFVDLFSGAGGLGLGFVWAGWQPLVANEIEPSFLETYRTNVHPQVVLGDIRDRVTFNKLISKIRSSLPVRRDGPLWVLGGPPCQGFSTAGKPRTMEDERNHLFWNYKELLDVLQPDGFVFENVTGLLNMEGGRTFQEIHRTLAETCETVTHWVLSAEEYAIPQRRKRVFIIGRNGAELPQPPKRITALTTDADLFGDLQPAISVEEALSDLPPLQHGQDGSCLPYRSEPCTAYQELMRGHIGPEEYLRRIVEGER